MQSMTPDRFLELLGRLAVWRAGDRRAPHKPLLLLWALGRVGWGGRPRLTPYHDPAERAHRDEVETPLRDLLARFGLPAPRSAQHPEHPFWRLRKDGLWEIPEHDTVPEDAKGNPGIRPLRATRGGLPEPIHRLVATDPALVQRAAQLLLDAHFPASLHADIRRAVGLPAGASVVRDREARDPRFRQAVLRAYERRCAVCGFDVRIEDSLIGLEAAHIKWHAAGGPDEVANGLALCAFHHKALDLGAVGLETRGRDVVVLVSDELSGTSPAFTHQLLAFVDHPLRAPQDPTRRPAPDYVAWHREEVFRGAPRG